MNFLLIIQTVLYLAAIILGLKFFVINKSPLYFKLVFSALVCFFLEKLYYLVDYACAGVWQNAFSFAAFGAGAGYAFLFSANFGQFDSFVDDGSAECKRAKKTAFIAPLVLVVVYCFLFIHCIKSGSVLFVVLTIVSKLPVFFAAFYHCKHLILPDVMHFMVDSLRPFNAACLLLIAADTISDIFTVLGYTSAYRISETVMALLFVIIIILAERGHKQWKI